MASVSISLTVAQATDSNVNDPVAGTAVPGTGDFELRVDMAKFTSVEQILLALDKLAQFLQSPEKGPTTFKVI